MTNKSNEMTFTLIKDSKLFIGDLGRIQVALEICKKDLRFYHIKDKVLYSIMICGIGLLLNFLDTISKKEEGQNG